MQTIGVFFGSRSPEHDISIITGEFVIAELKKLGYPVVPIYLGKKGEWYVSETLGKLAFFTQPNFEVELGKNNFEKYFLDLETSHGKLVFRRKGITGREVVVDIAFPALHGANGEDGTIQGLFELLDVPYIGCGVPASAIAMDKVLTKELYTAAGIATTPFIYFSRSDWNKKREALLADMQAKLQGALFVKPPHLGSSIGIAKVKANDVATLEEKIDVALHYDDTVLIEEAVENVMDLTCAVLENSENELTASLVQESAFQSDLFDFAGKYLNEGGAQLGKDEQNIIIPARLSEEITNQIQTNAKTIFRLVGASGIARIDFLFDRKTEKLYANEVNPLPGTLYHHLWKASGFEIGDVIKQLFACALARQTKKKETISTFASSVLQEAGSLKLWRKQN